MPSRWSARWPVLAVSTALVALTGVVLTLVLISDGDGPSTTGNGCGPKPDGSNTGPTAGAELTPAEGGGVRTDGQVMENRVFSGLVDIYADDVIIRNSTAPEGIRVRGAHVTIDHVATSGIAVRGGSGHLIEYNDISGGDDGMHMSSTGEPVSDVTVRNNYVHDPDPAPDAHVDGIQVRGINGLRLICNNFDLAPYHETQNGVIFLQWEADGNHDVTIDRNWLDGGGSVIFVAAENLRIIDNRFGRGFGRGVCRQGEDASGRRIDFISQGNRWDDTGEPVNLCGQG